MFHYIKPAIVAGCHVILRFDRPGNRSGFSSIPRRKLERHGYREGAYQFVADQRHLQVQFTCHRNVALAGRQLPWAGVDLFRVRSAPT